MAEPEQDDVLRLSRAELDALIKEASQEAAEKAVKQIRITGAVIGGNGTFMVLDAP